MWPLFFIFTVSAQEQASEKFCFPSERENLRVQHELKGMLVPSDRLTSSGQCLILTVNSHRRELLQRFILQASPNAQIEFSSSEIKREPCRLKVEKISHQNQSSGSVIVNPFSGTANTREEKKSSKEIYQIQTLKDFELVAQQDVILGECRSLTPDRYEIALTIRKDPKPLLPGAPEGSIIILNNPPPDQNTSSLTTTLQLRRGERIEVGSLARKLREKGHDVEAKPQAEISESQQLQSEEVFLSIE